MRRNEQVGLRLWFPRTHVARLMGTSLFSGYAGSNIPHPRQTKYPRFIRISKIFHIWLNIWLTILDEGSHHGKSNELEHGEHRQHDPRSESKLFVYGGAHASRDEDHYANYADEDSSQVLEGSSCAD